MSADARDSAEQDDIAREWRLYLDAIDPIAQQVLAADDSWATCEAANQIQALWSTI
jgi:hypothetical protein